MTTVYVESILVCQECKVLAKAEGYKFFKMWKRRVSLDKEECFYCHADLWDVAAINYVKEARR